MTKEQPITITLEDGTKFHALIRNRPNIFFRAWRWFIESLGLVRRPDVRLTFTGEFQPFDGDK